eukprot:jgi/Mesen1/1274/ME000013S00764
MGYLNGEPGRESFTHRVILVSSSVLFSLLLSDRLTLMYTIGAATISGVAFLVGIFLDVFGPRVTVCFGSLILWTALLALAYAGAVSNWLYYYGFFGLAVGGPCIYNSLTNFGELFGRQSAVIISAQTGAFNASSIVMFAIGHIVTGLGVSFRSAMLAYSLVPLLVCAWSLFMYPDRPYSSDAGSAGGGGEIHRVWRLRQQLNTAKSGADAPALPAGAAVPVRSGGGSGGDAIAAGAGAEGEITAPLLAPLLGGRAPTLTSQQQLLPASEAPSPEQLYNVAFARQIRSPVFWSVFVVSGFYVLRLNFYIASITSQLTFQASTLQSPPFSDAAAAKEAANLYVTIFNVLLPVGGVLSVPLLGYVLVYVGLGPAFIVIAASNIVFSIFNVLYWIPIQFQIVGFVCYTISRAFTFGALAAYIARLFGFANFGKLYGFARLSGAIATILSYPLANLAETSYGGNYFYVNLGFIVVEVLLCLFPVYLVKYVFSGFFFRPGYFYALDLEEENASGEA